MAGFNIISLFNANLCLAREILFAARYSFLFYTNNTTALVKLEAVCELCRLKKYELVSPLFIDNNNTCLNSGICNQLCKVLYQNIMLIFTSIDVH